jgi:hypothetical protein
MDPNIPEPPKHFKGKDAIGHVAEAKAEGIISANELHGTETPGRISAAADGAREISIVLLLTGCALAVTGTSSTKQLILLALVALALMLWKAGRSAWLGWSRLERLHRVLAQEKWEIEHHRPQEREELRVLYTAKGFEGKLLEDVLDVLMADGNRLLKVMVNEEMGLSLEAYDHPITQGLGALIGSFLASAICLAGFALNPHWGLLVGALVASSIAISVSASHAGNRITPAIVWNVGLVAICFGTIYFLIEYIFGLLT